VSWDFPLGPDSAEIEIDRSGGFDPSRPHPARVYQAWLGGKDTFGPDRAVADKVAEIAPWVVAGARGNRAFLTRAITHLARAGIRQFLDVGSGLPSSGNVHEIAQGINPDAKVVYVDHDPIVLVHARALLACDGRTIAVAGDASDPASILANPDVRGHLDFRQPIAVLFIAVLHFLGNGDDPAGVVAVFRDALAPGSYIAISHVADLPDEGGPARAAATREAVGLYEEMAAPFVLRTPERITGLFTGLQLVDPGVVPVHLWQPARGRPGPAVPVLGGVGRVTEPGRGEVLAGGPAGAPARTPSDESAGALTMSGSLPGPHLDGGPGQDPTPLPDPDAGLGRATGQASDQDRPEGRS
jgi:SAM-dependent methyltransferase